MRPPLARPVHRKPRLPDIETLSVEVLTFLAEEPERLDGFLSSSGLGIGDLRAVAVTPAFAESLLDHLCSDERLLVPFAEDKGYDPASIERLRQSMTPSSFED